MAVLVTAHPRVPFLASQDVDGRDSACGRPGHDEEEKKGLELPRCQDAQFLSAAQRPYVL